MGRARTTVHPRACGERWHSGRFSGFVYGSSPRLRGTPKNSTARPTTPRFIPAPAGNAPRVCSVMKRWSVHPRACGERLSFGFATVRCSGSSPRLRGTRRRIRTRTLLDRFIPAPAGNAHIPPRRGRLSAVHPRACGERSVPMSASESVVGSSPRLRGTPMKRCALALLLRFIPAPAGNAAASAGQ